MIFPNGLNPDEVAGAWPTAGTTEDQQLLNDLSPEAAAALLDVVGAHASVVDRLTGGDPNDVAQLGSLLLRLAVTAAAAGEQAAGDPEYRIQTSRYLGATHD